MSEVDPIAAELEELRESSALQQQRIDELEESFKARATSRIGAAATLVKDLRQYAAGERDFPQGSVLGVLHAFLVRRIVLVVGSVIGGLVLTGQTYIMCQQSAHMDVANSILETSNELLEENNRLIDLQLEAQVAQNDLSRLTQRDAERREALRILFDRCLTCPPNPDGDFPHTATANVRVDAVATLVRAANTENRSAGLSGVDLRDLTFPEEVDLRRADLRRANLADAGMLRGRLEDANLAYAILRRANLSLAQLSRADLYEADLSGAWLMGATVEHADLARANLSGATLDGARLEGSRLTNTDLRDASLCDAKLGGADLTGAELDGTRYTARTVWPAGFEIEGRGLVLVE